MPKGKSKKRGSSRRSLLSHASLLSSLPPARRHRRHHSRRPIPASTSGGWQINDLPTPRSFLPSLLIRRGRRRRLVRLLLPVLILLILCRHRLLLQRPSSGRSNSPAGGGREYNLFGVVPVRPAAGYGDEEEEEARDLFGSDNEEYFKTPRVATT